jgi:hypothetical protein
MFTCAFTCSHVSPILSSALLAAPRAAAPRIASRRREGPASPLGRREEVEGANVRFRSKGCATTAREAGRAVGSTANNGPV